MSSAAAHTRAKTPQAHRRTRGLWRIPAMRCFSRRPLTVMPVEATTSPGVQRRAAVFTSSRA